MEQWPDGPPPYPVGCVLASLAAGVLVVGVPLLAVYLWLGGGW